jgi:hypothetical protein
MRTQSARRTPALVPAARSGTGRAAAGHVGHFLAELGGMCAVMCAAGGILSFASFEAASGLGYPNLARQSPELSVAIIAVCLAVPMAVYMAVRRHGRRHNTVMTASTIAVAVVVIGLLWSGLIATTGDLQTWRGLFGLVCGPACMVMVVQMLISFNMYSGRRPAGQTQHAGQA